MDYDTAKRQHDATMKTAVQMMQDDLLLRHIVLASVSEAMHEHGPVNLNHVEKDAYDIATMAVAISVARMMNEGDGLAALKAERDAYKKAALTFAELAPPRPFIIAASPQAAKE